MVPVLFDFFGFGGAVLAVSLLDAFDFALAAPAPDDFWLFADFELELETAAPTLSLIHI